MSKQSKKKYHKVKEEFMISKNRKTYQTYNN